jgi:hypothetical protein
MDVLSLPNAAYLEAPASRIVPLSALDFAQNYTIF